jgi:hypothetical protein
LETTYCGHGVEEKIMKYAASIVVSVILLSSCTRSITGNVVFKGTLPRELQIRFLDSKQGSINAPINADGEFAFSLSRSIKEISFNGCSFVDDSKKWNDPDIVSINEDPINIQGNIFLDGYFFIDRDMNFGVDVLSTGWRFYWRNDEMENCVYSVRIYSPEERLLKEVFLKGGEIHITRNADNDIVHLQDIKNIDIEKPIFSVDEEITENRKYKAILSLFYKKKGVNFKYIAINEILLFKNLD